eukprot:TRINITY_DN6246_c0_g1_i1.p1 TRINITY_DN6246_c0_g1~~TRINITY_DN6246_c0_g1_i1.p1  ORF type:complete len:997 (+),score=190.10 TRINITY_DN6246_c0_g1_i1:118-3108(+)
MEAMNASSYSSASGGATGSGELKLLKEQTMEMQILMCTFLVVSMQLGFAMLEVGSVRPKHRMTVLAKNLLDSVVSCLTFTMVCTLEHWTIVEVAGVPRYHLKLFHWAFLATSVTICSGSMAERTQMTSYISYAVIMSSAIYPVLAESAWGPGVGSKGILYPFFHTNLGGGGHRYRDFAGSGVVHLAGGSAALVGNLLLGRRILTPRPEESGEDSETKHPWQASKLLASPLGAGRNEAALQPDEEAATTASSPSDKFLQEACWTGWRRRFDCLEDDRGEFTTNSYLQVLGMFQLWVGWYGFNSGAAIAKGGPHSIALASLVAWNTSLAASAGAVGAYMNQYSCQKNLDVGFLCNGVLSGLVAITAACDIATPLAAALIGLCAGLIVYPMGSRMMRKCRLDDPVDAVPVHAGCGLFGVLSAGLCHPDCRSQAFLATTQYCLGDHSKGWQFLAQAWGAFTIMWWTMGISLILWGAFTICEGIRTLEVQHLVEAYSLALGNSISGAAEGSNTGDNSEAWKRVTSHSQTLRQILRQHGWKGGIAPFVLETDVAVEEFRRHLLLSIHNKVKTALELDNWAVHPFFCLARSAAKLRPLRELALVRLRISPVAELSGVGAAASDGVQLLTAMKSVMQMLTEIRQDQGIGNLPLQLEVDQLCRDVQSQGLLLHRLAKGRRVGVNTLSSVPEEKVKHKLSSSRSGGSRAGVEQANRHLPKIPIGSIDSGACSSWQRPPGPAALEEQQQQLARASQCQLGLLAASQDFNGPAEPKIQRGREPSRSRGSSPRGSTPGLGISPCSRVDAGGCEGNTGAAAQVRSATPEDRPRLQMRPGYQPFGSRHTTRSSTASTVSERSMGMLSPRSAGTATPPPTLYGRMAAAGLDAAARGGASGAGPDQVAPTVEAVAAQLVHFFQAQHGLMTALQASQAVGPAQQAGQAQVQAFHNQLLTALQHQQPISSHPSSSRSALSRRSRSISSFELGENSSNLLPSTPGSQGTVRGHGFG